MPSVNMMWGSTLAKLIYFMPVSLDGYLAGENSDLDWSVPDEEELAFLTDVIRPIGVYLLGRKRYETMAVWQTPEVFPDPTPATLDFARVWQAAEKVAYSRSRETVSTPRTRLERTFQPDTVREWKAQSRFDLTVSGPNLAEQAIRSGLVDEYQLMVAPAVLGGGKRVLPAGVRIPLELVEERRFRGGMVYLRYRAGSGAGES